MSLANSISGLFHGSGGGNLGIGSGFGSQAGMGGGETVVNNYYGDSGRDTQSAGYDGDDDDDSAGTSDADYQSDDGGSDDSYDA